MKINRKRTEVMVSSKDFENINITMDDNALKQVPKCKCLGYIYIYIYIYTEDWKNEEDIIQRIKEAKGMFNDENQLLCLNNLSLEMEKEIYKSLYLECCSLWVRYSDRMEK